MSTLFKFTKMHGLGNDFVVFDGISQNIDLSKTQIQGISDRHTGIGCDQLLVVTAPPRPQYDFGYRIFNADGSEVEHCGNGARCLGKFVTDKHLTGKRKISVATVNRSIDIEMLGRNLVKVDMGAPAFQPSHIPFGGDSAIVQTIAFEGESIEFQTLSMGNPHAVILVDDIEQPIEALATFIQRSELFPESVNVGFLQVENRSRGKLRVYERGVGETQACGTGACAAAVAGIRQGLFDHNLDLSLLGGELNIAWQENDSPVYMSGPAEKVFEGQIRL